MTSALSVKLRPLEREDLRFVHQLDNNASVMRYWFEEPYEAFVELSDLYDKHIHDQSERRFVVECDGEKAGWSNWLKLTMSTVGLNFRSLFPRNIREKVSPHGPLNWRWTTDLPYLTSISCTSSLIKRTKRRSTSIVSWALWSKAS